MMMKPMQWALVALTFLALSLPASARMLPDFVPLAEEHSPAVVNIATTRERENPHRGQMPDFEGTPFEDLFERFFGGPGGSGERAPESFERNSLGSGFIYTEDGYIITANHVVDGASEVVVHLSDRRVFDAEIVGKDPQSDVALLKIDAEDLPTLKLGSSSDLKVGEWVLAIGSPFGFDHSVTAGIVSAKGRNLPTENYVPFIQTDVAINPGNSGGPLLNLDGEVIGINAQIYSRTGGFMGLSFAVPIEMVEDVVQQLREHGEVTRGWLGVLIQEVTRELADSFGMDKPTGALVARVQADSPAQKAGFETGDVILSFNGIEVPNSSALPPIVGRTPVGTEAEVEVRRGEETRTITVEIERLPDDISAQRGGPQRQTPERTEPQSLLGMVLEPLEAERAAELDVDAGVVVREVVDNPARSAGLRPGDVIVQFGGHAIDSAETLEQQIAEVGDRRTVPVLVYRGDNPTYIALRIPRD
ncbi:MULTISPECIES: DegQ family serine endoprotease [unclassified Thioalkalivibrio]|uniref:DegQ family serine endoprotease n=1 Tax=unclassified Thioalkalivibrio TaxID=2621013 RepID=UPI000369224B|nr:MULTISPECIES: DegQ family serine endoprotease [unclassified Thioalkalivibrio]